MIDWQNIMVSNPSKTSLDDHFEFTLSTRRNDEEALLAYYADTMQGLGADFSLDAVREHYDRAILFIMNFHMIIAGAFVPSDERARQMASEGLDRAVRAVTDRGLIKLIP